MQSRRVAHTAEFRGALLMPLSIVVDNLIELRRATYLAYQGSLDPDGDNLLLTSASSSSTPSRSDRFVEPTSGASHRLAEASRHRWND